MKYWLFSLLALIAHPVESARTNNSVLVAIIDTGLDRQNQELAQSLWKNSAEIADNNLDDDGNGLVDDVSGWDFCNDTADLSDRAGHGTHITGIIHQAVKSEAPFAQAHFMVLKYDKGCAPDAFAKAVAYALDHGAQIINISGGGFTYSRKEVEVLKRAEQMKIPIISAAGNKDPKESHRPFFPAAYNFENILSVVATNSLGQSLATSNINPRKKNIFARGENILSTLPGNRIAPMTGASQAAARVTGHLVPLLATHTLHKKLDSLVAFYSNPIHSW